MTMHEPRVNRSPICGVPTPTRSRLWTLRRLANADRGDGRDRGHPSHCFLNCAIFFRARFNLYSARSTVRSVNVGEAAASRENCARLRDELWFKGREWFQDRACSMPKDDALIAELTSPTYAFTSTGKMVVESKADMKKRGLRSPDLADAFLLTFACGERKIERYRRPVRRCSAWAA